MSKTWEDFWREVFIISAAIALVLAVAGLAVIIKNFPSVPPEWLGWLG